jgi:hypothetical protein
MDDRSGSIGVSILHSKLRLLTYFIQPADRDHDS